jgi:AAA15 family ATPase/GTPase
MITKARIKNFKRLEEVTLDLSQSVVIIGPNNAGKTTIFQALCLWEIGVTSFIRSYKKGDLNRSGYVTLNRKDLLTSPISDARYLWRNKRVTKNNNNGKLEHIKLEVELFGDESGKNWNCAAEFTFANAESLTCRITDGLDDIVKLYDNDHRVHFGFLQPMSGISTQEDKFTQGSIDRKLGEGKTAEVLRNICFDILYPEVKTNEKITSDQKWETLTVNIKKLFGATLLKPQYIKATGFLELEYTENDIRYDVSSGGRGFQQMLLLLAYMYAHPNTILLLDEPDAHLEVIRQRDAFQLINDIANSMNAQLFIASHSEVVLEEAAEASNVIALIENTAVKLNFDENKVTLKNITKSLTEIGWDEYYKAKLTGHILYLEGSTDLHMLQKFAEKTRHKVSQLLHQANVQYTSDNVPGTAINNYTSKLQVFPQLKGLALFDYKENLRQHDKLKIISWKKRELENYFAKPDLLLRHAKLLTYRYSLSATQLEATMQKCIEDYTQPINLRDVTSEWWSKAKLTDEWLDLIFPEFYRRLGLPQGFYKRDYYELINLLTPEEVSPEIIEKLDVIYDVIKKT